MSAEDIAARTLVIERLVSAPVAAVWGAWMNAESLPKWWGPAGFSCRTKRIDLRAGGEWLFDMIGPDGTVYPNHHRYGAIEPLARIEYTLLWGEDGPKHADATATFLDQNGATKVTLSKVMASVEEATNARNFGAVEMGQQTLAKLEAVVLAI